MPQALSDSDLWSLLERMLLMRRFEERVLRMAKEGHFTGHYHLYTGQEATGATAIAALGPDDKLATTHRNHGHIVARGADPGKAMAEILGRATGLNGGRGGTLHLCDPSLGFLSTSGIVGGCISLAVGGGYACKQKKNGSVSIAFFGDGALEEGVAFEALNIAALWHLPVIFLCENNSTGAWGPSKGGYPTLTHASKDLCLIPQSVGIPSVRVDGADIDAVQAAFSDGLARCRAGDGPVFIETMTKRWPGSNPLWPELVTGVTDIGMATGEMPVGEEQRDWFENHDPILRLVRRLAEGGKEAVARLHKIDKEVLARIDAAAEFALKSPFPEDASALARVFA